MAFAFFKIETQETGEFGWLNIASDVCQYSIQNFKQVSEFDPSPSSPWGFARWWETLGFAWHGMTIAHIMGNPPGIDHLTSNNGQWYYNVTYIYIYLIIYGNGIPNDRLSYTFFFYPHIPKISPWTCWFSIYCHHIFPWRTRNVLEISANGLRDDLCERTGTAMGKNHIFIFWDKLTVISIHLSFHLSIYRSIHPSIYPSIYLSIHPSIHLSISLSVCLSISLSVCLSIHLSICHLSIYLHIHIYIYIQ